MIILAIDPGNIESGYAIIEMPDFKLLDFGKVKNEVLLQMLISYQFIGWDEIERDFTFDKVAVEMVASYGMAVGKSVFDTCVWIGRFIQALEIEDVYNLSDFVYRKDEKMCLCGSMKAKDSNIRQALIDRYAKHDFKNGKGVKKNPDTFYGVSKDVWQAIAVGVTYYEKVTEERRNNNE
jgi:Holliday junction resolvasome RuvABC endonuclease subunit